MSGVGKKRNDIRFYTTIELKIMTENGSLSSKKKEEIISDEKDNAETSTKYRTSSSETAFVSNSDLNDFNQIFFNEQNNVSCEENYIFTNKDIASKTISPVYTFFQCNEAYLKEKMPERSNYKKKSRNYILKSKFKSEKKDKQDSTCNILKLEDIDLNKVDEILKDIEYVQDNINNNDNNKNKFDETDINVKINLDELSKIPIETFQTIDIDYSLCSCLNNYKFDCKYSFLYYYIILLFS
jgi:hypothetical protein